MATLIKLLPLSQSNGSHTSKSARTKTFKRGGFECEFVQEPPKLIQNECPVCLQTLCEPYQISCCGYSFCKVCIERVQNEGKDCPTCKQKSFNTFHNKGLQRSLYQLRVYCTHKKQGCKWTGELGQLDKHLNLNPQPDKQLVGCQYSEIKCHYCIELIQRHTITTHQADLCERRPFSCKYCKYTSNYDDIIYNHWLSCGFHPVPCPNECGTFPQRQNLQTHITNQCPLTVIDCDFHHVGCDVKLPRKGMPTHLKENLVTHTSLQAASHSKLLLAYTELQTSHKAMQERIVQLETENQILKCQNSPCTGTPTPCYIELTMHNYEQHKKAGDGWYSPPFYTHHQGYKMCVDINANGRGDGKGTHLSVFVLIVRGEFDDHLKWPFRGEITIQLLNQEEDKEHLSEVVPFNDKTPKEYSGRVTVGERSKGRWGFKKFISHDKLQPKYLKNNCLCFRIPRIVLY